MLKVISILLLAALLAGCTAVEEATPVPTQEPPQTEGTGGPPESAAPPVDGAGATATPPAGGATATPYPPAPVPTPEPDKVVPKSGTPLEIDTPGAGRIRFPTDHDACEDVNYEWDCLVEEGTASCTLTGINAPSTMPMQITVHCLDFDSPGDRVEYSGVIQ